MYHYLVGVGALLLLSAAWLAVQQAWKGAFPEVGGDPDALARRPGCYGCRDSKDCHRGPESGACEAQEEMP